eukprot:14025-Chlamydomonas_euryale.AAC.1
MPRFIGPFPITKVVGKVAYMLELPHTLKQLHNVFNVCLLKPYRDDGRYQPPGPVPMLDQESDFYDVELLLDTRVVRRGRGYARQCLTKWDGYGEEHTSWEPEDNVKGCIAYQQFWDNRPRPPSLKDAYKSQTQRRG